MDVERWERIEHLFEAAVELDPAEREAFLDTACGSDAEFRAEVEELLRADASATDYFDAFAEDVLGAAMEPALAHHDTLVGAEIGPYRIVAPLGRGGMGAVYRAERADGAFEQEVALKVVRRDLSPEGRARFLAERRILARLQHPNVARLLDAGVTADGRPYFVMEIVEGEPITAYCDRERLGVDDRLRLFLTVCTAVAHAHHQLVVHRDLKPSNVLVAEATDGTLSDGAASVKLLDFGVAKLLEDDAHGLTMTGLGPMTPEYAAPEQVRGEPVSTATDVYALGVLLYELLTGHRPYEITDHRLPTVAAAVCEQDPARPSTVIGRSERRSVRGETREVTPEEVSAHRSTSAPKLARRIAGDLDNIVLKALRKEPDRRYGSAEALAADVRRHLDEKPVSARPDTVGYRTSRFVRRHRAGVLATALVALALVAGLGVALWQAGRAEAAARQAQREADTATEVTDFLIGLFRGSDPYVSALPDSTLRARALLDRGLRGIEELRGEPDVQARLFEAIAKTYQGLGLYDQALAVAERALTLRHSLYGDRHPEVAANLATLGGIYADRAELDRAEQALREALAVVRGAGERDWQTESELLNRLGMLSATRGEHAEAERLYRASLALKQRVSGVRSSGTATLLHNLADLYRHRGQFGRAVALFDSSIAIHRQLPDAEPLALGMSLGMRSLALRDGGDFAEALASAEESLRLLEDQVPPDHPRLLRTQLAYASVLVRLGRLDEATPLLRHVLEVSADDLGRNHWRTVETELWLGAALTGQGQFAEAEPLLLHGYEGLRSMRGDDDRYVREVRQTLAQLYGAWGRPEEAARYAGPAGAGAQ
jgi:serine/threonine-protein kinase